MAPRKWCRARCEAVIVPGSSLSAADKAKLKKEVSYLADGVEFPGFDGNNEAEQLGIARFLIERLGRFSSFKGRGLNSHSLTRSEYSEMLKIFGAIRPKLKQKELSVAQIVEIFRAGETAD